MSLGLQFSAAHPFGVYCSITVAMQFVIISTSATHTYRMAGKFGGLADS